LEEKTEMTKIAWRKRKKIQKKLGIKKKKKEKKKEG
jgi:hypothetical protein